MNLKYTFDNSIKVNSSKILNEGISNTSYLINNEFVMRIKSSKHDIFNLPSNEGIVIEKLSGQDFVEEVIKFDMHNGNKLSKFIPNTTRLSNPPTKLEAEKVAKLLKKLHSLDIKINHWFSPFERIEFYKKGCKSEIDPEYEKLIIEKSKKIYEAYPLILSHNDIVKGNLLYKEDKLYLLDYEFAGLNIYLFDLASFISENNIIDEEVIEHFLKSYGNVKRCELNTIIKMENILWYYWAKFNYMRTKRKVYLAIANDKLNTIKKEA